ncbi:DinB family protein [Pedobacter metabolipauper]|uniref:Putative damage-inducible protein DinB n=1 Tax=Pedobacter metabolipauper TaxID=425513 RepID=A0A4R6STX2_9SPHI|nr:DinB family protein [Pedobacter metabolipauper]TDQ08220.1 putative damage-inducible protein DinB [Pedobacter metabolipauper]
MTTENINTETTAFLSAEDLLNHWQGHRRLTRRVIEAFPDDKLFIYSIGGMRTFADMVMELIDISAPGVAGIVTNDWGNVTAFSNHSADGKASTKSELLALWDKETEEINRAIPMIPEGRFQETILAFGQYEGEAYSTVLYFIDNEIHHRAQGTVYLRSLGIEPPAFWNRD